MTHPLGFVDQEIGPMIVSGGLAYAIKFAEALGPALLGRDVDIMISGIRDGLFFHDEIRGRAIRVTMNKTGGCGRMYVGDSSDFEYDTRTPKETLTPYDWEDRELPAMVGKAVTFFATGSL